MTNRTELKIAICDDVSHELEALKDMLINYTGSRSVDFIISEFDSGEALLKAYEKKKFDILFLDIQMVGMSGIELAKRIREKEDQNTVIIFISNHSGFMKDAFDVQPFNYLEKQFFESDKKEEFRIKFETVLDDALKKFENDSNIIAIKNKLGHKVFFRVKDILYIESADGEEGTLNIFYHNEKYECVGVLKHIFDQLSDFRFIYASRWCVVNMTHITELDSHDLYLDNGKVISVGRYYQSEVKRLFSSFVLNF